FESLADGGRVGGGFLASGWRHHGCFAEQFFHEVHAVNVARWRGLGAKRGELRFGLLSRGERSHVLLVDRLLGGLEAVHLFLESLLGSFDLSFPRVHLPVVIALS